MECIRFLARKDIVFDCIFTYINDNEILLTFDDDIPSLEVCTSGFEILNTYNYQNMTGNTYHKFNMGEINGMTVKLNKTKPEIKPTELPKEENIDDVKDSKISELRRQCNAAIINGVQITLENNESKHFSYSDEDQINIKEMYDLDTEQYYHADNDNIELFSVEDIKKIYKETTLNKMRNVIYYNQLKQYVKALDDIEAVKKITYGQALTGTYKETYDNALQVCLNTINNL